MVAKIVTIESATRFTDGRQRVTLRFDGADGMFDIARFTVDALGLEMLGTGPHLDQELQVDFESKARRGGKS